MPEILPCMHRRACQKYYHARQTFLGLKQQKIIGMHKNLPYVTVSRALIDQIFFAKWHVYFHGKIWQFVKFGNYA